MPDEIQKLWNLVRPALWMVGATLVGWFGNQYMTDRVSFKEALNTNYSSFNAVTDDVNASLKIFADVAKGKRTKTDDDVAELQIKLIKAVGTAEDLGRRLKEQAEVRAFKVAAMNLKVASDKATGPLDSKDLVKAADDYFFAESELRDRVVKQHNSLFF